MFELVRGAGQGRLELGRGLAVALLPEEGLGEGEARGGVLGLEHDAPFQIVEVGAHGLAQLEEEIGEGHVEPRHGRDVATRRRPPRAAR